ncbi:hypothetical protein OSB04_015919, partial [Centaurea solstitialis]
MLGMPKSEIVQVWKGEKRRYTNSWLILKKLKYLNIRNSKLKTLDLEVTPNLKDLKLSGCRDLVEVIFPLQCLELTYIDLSHTKLRTLDLQPTVSMVADDRAQPPPPSPSPPSSMGQEQNWDKVGQHETKRKSWTPPPPVATIGHLNLLFHYNNLITTSTTTTTTVGDLHHYYLPSSRFPPPSTTTTIVTTSVTVGHHLHLYHHHHHQLHKNLTTVKLSNILKISYRRYDYSD